MLYAGSVEGLRLPYLSVILDAVRASNRTDREVSLAATGQPTAIALIKSNRAPSVERVRLLCEELGLEFRIGPYRTAAPAEIAQALGLPEGSSVEDAVRAIGQSKQLMADAVSALQASTEAQLDTYRRESTRMMAEMLNEFHLTDPDHLQNAPYHAVPFATEVRPTGQPSEVEFVLASMGLSFRRPEIKGWAEWRHLVCMGAPDGTGDLIVLDTMELATPKDGLLVLNVSSRELARGLDCTFLILSGEGLGLRDLRWVDNSWWLYDENRSSRRRLGGGDWLLGRIAARVSADFLRTGHSSGS